MASENPDLKATPTPPATGAPGGATKPAVPSPAPGAVLNPTTVGTSPRPSRPQPAPLSDEEKKAKAAKDAAGATEGARTVAEAVDKVAKAAVAELAKDRRTPDEIVFAGSPGGTFEITDALSRFGSGGTVKINGVQALTNGWGASRIEGLMPEGAADKGKVEILVSTETTLTCDYPA
jgi:hypothetical protein